MKIYPCDNPDPYCPFDAQSSYDCRDYCGLGVDEDEEDEINYYPDESMQSYPD